MLYLEGYHMAPLYKEYKQSDIVEQEILEIIMG